MTAPRLFLMLLYRPVRLVPVVFATAAFLLWLSINANRHNPNSHFFAPDEHTFASTYSDMRRTQARNFIADVEARIEADGAQAWVGGAGPFPRYRSKAANAPPDLAVVFVTSPRNDVDYLDISLGSFLSELTPQQRESMHVMVSEGDRVPLHAEHLKKLWLHALVDEIGLREPVDRTSLPSINASQIPEASLAKLAHYPLPKFNTKNMPTKVSQWHQSGSIDYSVALQMCGSIAAPHCLVVEDDVVFASQWYEPFAKSLQYTEKHYGRDTKAQKHWGYIRLFYSEKYFGWENDEVPKLVMGIVGFVAVFSLFLIVFVRFPAGQVALVRETRPAEYPKFPSGKSRQSPRPSYVDMHNTEGYDEQYDMSQSFSCSVSSDYDEDAHGYKDHADADATAPSRILLPIGTVFLLGILALYSCILLILSGRNYFYHVSRGVSEMPTRGCCTQAIVYPLGIVTDLMEQVRFWHLERPYQNNINRWLDTQNLVKLAVHPPLVQHIGAGLTRQLVDHTYERGTPLWSFAFEKLHMPQRPH